MAEEIILSPVSYYGLHYAPDGVAYCHQGRGSANMMGMKTPSPFQVQPFRKMACPHAVNATSPIPDQTHWDLFLRLYKDQLVKEMLPIPKTHGSAVPYFVDVNNQLALPLVLLSRMSSPIYPCVHDIKKMNGTKILDALSITNISPLVLTGVEEADHAFMMLMAKESVTLPRKLILVGGATLPIHRPLARMVTDIEDYDELTLAALPLETLGATVLRRYARHDIIDAPQVRRVSHE